MAEHIVSDPNTEVDGWLDSDDPNDVGVLAAEPGAEGEPGAGPGLRLVTHHIGSW